MGNPSAAQEPSMEEILASIRQIISEDGDQSQDGGASSGAEAPSGTALGGAAEADEGSSEAQQAAGEGIEAEVSRSDSPSPAAAAPIRAPQSPQPQSSEPASPRAAEPSPSGQSGASSQREPVPQTPTVAKPATQPSPQVKPASTASGTSPASTMIGPDSHRLLSPKADASVSGAFSALAHTILAQNARTLEDLVSEMLRPMLKDWLDDNLPPLVERLVKEEIERVSRGRR